MTREKAKVKGFVGQFLSPDSLHQFKRYIITGGLAAGLEYGLFNLLLIYAGLWHVYAHIFSMTAGFILSFLLNKYWSFGTKENFARQFFLTAALFFINLGISSFVIYGLVSKLHILEQLSKILVMGMVVVWNFILFKKVIYRR